MIMRNTVIEAEDNLNKVNVKTLQEIKREKQEKRFYTLEKGTHDASIDERRLTSASVVTHGESTPTSLVSKLGMQRPIRQEPNHVLGLHQQMHQTRSPKPNGVSLVGDKLLGNGANIPRNRGDLANGSNSGFNDTVSWDIDELLDEDLEPHDEDDELDDLPKEDLSSRDVAYSLKSSVVLDRGETLFHNGTTDQVATNYSDSEVQQGAGENDQDEIVSIHPGTTEFYEESDDNWCTNQTSKYPKLKVKVPNETQDLRAIINRKHLAVRKGVGTTAWTETTGVRFIECPSENSSIDESMKERSWKDEKDSRTSEWCSSLANLRGRGNFTAIRSFAEPQHIFNNVKADILSVPVSEEFTQPSLPQTDAHPFLQYRGYCGAGTSRQGCGRVMSLGVNPFGMGKIEMGPSSNGPSGIGPSNLGTSGIGPSRLSPSGLGPSRLGPSGIGPSNLGTSGIGPSRLGPSGLGPSRLGPSGIGPSSLGPSGIGPSSLGPSGIGPSSLGPSGIGPSRLGPSGIGLTASVSSRLGPPTSIGQTEMTTSSNGPSVIGPSSLGPSGIESSNLGPSGKRFTASVCSRLGPPTNMGLAEMHPTMTESNSGISPKRKYSSQESFERGRKIQASMSPSGFPVPAPINLDYFWESDLPPKGFCFLQLECGSCNRAWCKFRHIPAEAVEEYQRIKKMRMLNISPRESPPTVAPIIEMSENGPSRVAVQSDEQRQNEYQSNCEIVNSLLANRNLVGAMNLIEKMDKMQKSPGLAVIERVLCCCSQDKADPDINAQIAMKAFNLIGKVRGKYNRHNFTTLIECLCNAGQYVMAYEKLCTMKQNGYSPTLDVFLNLIKSSHGDPQWAFDLLEEIRSLDLLKSDICSELIILGSTSKIPLLSKVMSLYQETVHQSIKPSQKAYNTLIKFLCETGNWSNLCIVLCDYRGDLLQLSSEAVCGVIGNAWRKAEWVEGIVKLLFFLAQRGTIDIHPEAWNNLLAATCAEHYHRVEHIHQVAGLMDSLKVPFYPKSYNDMIAALSRFDQIHDALAVFDKMLRDTEALGDPSIQTVGLQSLCQALKRTGDVARLPEVLHIMMQTAIKPEESTLNATVETLVTKKNYVGIEQLLTQCEQMNVIPSVAIYRKCVLALEQWKDSPQASARAYLSFRKAYPVIPEETNDAEFDTIPHKNLLR